MMEQIGTAPTSTYAAGMVELVTNHGYDQTVNVKRYTTVLAILTAAEIQDEFDYLVVQNETLVPNTLQFDLMSGLVNEWVIRRNESMATLVGLN